MLKRNYVCSVYFWLIVICILDLKAQTSFEPSEKAKQTYEQLTTESSSWNWIELKETERMSRPAFLSKSRELFDLNEETEFEELRVNIREGWTHHRMQQSYKGVPVEGAIYLLHEKNGQIYTANGEVVSGLNLNAIPSLSEAEALKLLLDQINAETYAWEDPSFEAMVKVQQEDENATNYPKGSLVIAAPNADQIADNYVLAYKFTVETLKPMSHKEYIVNAHTGELVSVVSLLCLCNSNSALGICETHSYGMKSIVTNFEDNTYKLYDEGRNISTYSAQNTQSYDLFNIVDPDNNWTDLEDRTGCEAHWVAEQTYDYFVNTYGLEGYNGLGGRLLIWVNWGENLNGAWSNGGKLMIGDGDGSTWGPLSSIDIVAHEYVHSIIKTAGSQLNYRYESGALNESFADIFGTVVEYYNDPSNFDWDLGEDANLVGAALRSMSDPNTYGQPDTYGSGIENYWFDIEDCLSADIGNDYCGVHTNSGVQNYWFYLLCQGGSGTNDNGQNYNVSSIGINKATQIAYENMMNYLGPNSEYVDAYNGSIQAATALYGADSEEVAQVQNAWCAVGVGPCSISSAGQLTLTSPNGGETLGAGLVHPISWTSSGNIGNSISIEYSINGGSNWYSIVESTPVGSGSYEWEIPAYSSNSVLVRIRSNDNPTISDISDAYFSMEVCIANAAFSVNSDTICAGNGLFFNNQSTGANSYEWRINGGSPIETSQLTYPFTEAGTYTVELKATKNGVCADYESMNIVVLPLPDATFEMLLFGDDVELFAYNSIYGIDTSSQELSYYWSFGDGQSMSGEDFSFHTYTDEGAFDVCLTVTSVCGINTSCQTINIVHTYGCMNYYACNYDPDAIFDDGSCEYTSCGGGSCLVSDSLALIAIYNATDGANWNRLWNLSQAVATWPGVVVSEDGCRVVELNLSGRGLSGSIPTELGDLTSLTRINMNASELSGNIPSSLGNLLNLEYLYLDYNILSGSIPPELGNLSNLKTLKLSGNYLSGSIPASLGDLSNLTDLELVGNQLSGSIPSSLGNLLNLERLYLYYNQLSGSIPSELGDLLNLKYLHLGANQLSGNIPPELGDLSNLNQLELGYNQLSGSIPIELGGLSNLWGLTLANNQLSGMIPPELGGLSNLQQLTLGENQLSGNIPPELGNLSSLWLLYLENNQLSGVIPPELCNLSKLRQLNLEGNQLNGNIPLAFENLSSLTSLNLSHNQLSANIPSGLSTLSSLGTLDLSHNQLSGDIPVELGSLSRLIQLYLNNNQLTGCYPQEWCYLNLNLQYRFDCTNNPGLPDGGSDQGFQDFCANPSDCMDVYNVYPGDLNFDGIADYRDVVPHGMYFGSLGKNRVDEAQNTNWSAQSSSNWGVIQDNKEGHPIDIKHIDADGNGAIDLNDLLVTKENYGATHNASPYVMPAVYSSDSPVEMFFSTSDIPTFNGNDNVWNLDLMVQDTIGDEVSMYGGYFSFSYYHPADLIEDIEVTVPTSWLGTPGLDMVYIVHKDTINKKIDVGISRINHTDKEGEGPIIRVTATVSNDIPWDTTIFNFDINGIALHNSEALNLPIAANNMASSFTVVKNDCPSDLQLSASNGLQATHYASGVISTNGDVTVEANEEVEFRANEGDINIGFQVNIGGEFAFYNDPCSKTSDFNKPSNTTPNKNHSWEYTKEGLTIHYALEQVQSVTIELLGKNGKIQSYKLGKQSKGKHSHTIAANEMPELTTIACVKMGKKRHYFPLEK